MWVLKEKTEYEVSARLVGEEMWIIDIFFFKRETAYGFYYGLGGSEVFIRGKFRGGPPPPNFLQNLHGSGGGGRFFLYPPAGPDEEISVCLGGRGSVERKI